MSTTFLLHLQGSPCTPTLETTGLDRSSVGSEEQGLLLAVPVRLWVSGTAFQVKDVSRVQKQGCLNSVGGQWIKQRATSDQDSESPC